MTIQEAIQKYIDVPVILQRAKVLSVDDTMVEVQLLHNEKVKRKAKIQSVTGLAEGLKITPKKDSIVTIATVYNTNQDAFIVGYGEIESYKLTIEKTEIEINKDGYSIKKDEDSLKTLLESIIDMISKLTVSTGVGPSGTPLPPTVKACDDIKTTINKIFF